MVQASQRTTVRGSTFIQLLARLGDVDAPRSRASLPDRLGQWLSWTHALALSTALDGKPEAVRDEVPAFDGTAEDACVRARRALALSIETAREFKVSKPGETLAPLADYAPFRQRYIAIQRAMQQETGSLRGRLRDMLAVTSADMARLAELDAFMELALSPREQRLLGTVPALLGRHFDRLRQAGQAAPGEVTPSWLDRFRKDMQSVLLAELEVRFQPVEGLLAALRTC